MKLELENSLQLFYFRFVYESDGTPLSVMTRWKIEEPNNSGEEDCIDIYARTKVPMSLNDHECWLKWKYACQSETIQSATPFPPPPQNLPKN